MNINRTYKKKKPLFRLFLLVLLNIANMHYCDAQFLDYRNKDEFYLKIDRINNAKDFPSLFKQLSNLEGEKQIVYLDNTKRFIPIYLSTKYSDSLNIFINPTEHMKKFSYEGMGGRLEILLHRTITGYRYEDFVNNLLEPYSYFELEYHPFLKQLDNNSELPKKLNAICNGNIYLFTESSIYSEKKELKGHYYFDLTQIDSTYEYSSYQEGNLKKNKLNFQIPNEWKDRLKYNPKRIIFCAKVAVDTLTRIPKYISSVIPLLIIDRDDNIYETIEGFQFDNFSSPPSSPADGASGSSYLVDNSEITFESQLLVDEEQESEICNFFTQSLIEYFESPAYKFDLVKRFKDEVIFKFEKKKSASILNGDYGLIRINAKVLSEFDKNHGIPDRKKMGVTLYIDWTLYVASHPANKFGEPSSWQLDKFNEILKNAKTKVLQKMCEKYTCNKTNGIFKINLKNGKK